ncbi:aminotransferase class I/II-fold pyridoxal phosphate-dependent enzyme [Nocardiopsis rhodophaea]|uniref:aminotransferase class I/II-fold pyridoxal phosphate-dependent enzyme n=1 Tax=Nocardiopsis rhodophaea TaxID=280238 RepID=UPI0031D829B2
MAITGRGSYEIASSVEQAIIEGDLPSGTALPSIRDLASELGVNPNTVASAYRLLRDRGLVETGGRRGTRVRARPASLPRDTEAAASPDTRDAGSGNPDPRLLPDLGAALAAVAARRSGRHPLYGDPPILPEMRDEARAILEADGVPCSALTLTSGALDGIDRVLRSSLRPGDTVALEDPGWPSEYDLAAGLGLKRVPMRMDDEGPLPDDLNAALRGGARAVIVTNRAQNPTGAAISAERAACLRALLADHPQVLTVEDDHGFAFVDLPFQRIGGATERWTLVRSVAKGYGPDLRLAMVTGDPVTVDRVRAQQQSGHGWVSQVLQEAFVELRRRAEVSAERAGRSYGERRAGLIRELERHGLRGRGRSGVNVWVEVPDEARAVAGLLARRWSCTPGRRFRLDSPPGIRVTISALDTQDMATLAADIAAAVRPGGPAV